MIKMCWIKKQWESRYIEMAEHMVKDEVCIALSRTVADIMMTISDAQIS